MQDFKDRIVRQSFACRVTRERAVEEADQALSIRSEPQCTVCLTRYGVNDVARHSVELLKLAVSKPHQAAAVGSYPQDVASILVERSYEFVRKPIRTVVSEESGPIEPAQTAAGPRPKRAAAVGVKA